MIVTLLGATGPVGRALIERLAADAIPTIAVGRDPVKLASLPDFVATRVADFGDATALRVALADARVVVSCANAVHLPAILAALPGAGVERLVALGSTRVFSAVDDPTRRAVAAARTLLAAQPFPAMLLLSTMIYGTGSGVVAGLARLIRRGLPVPVPGGGGGRVQPIHVGDVASALLATLSTGDGVSGAIVIAGGTVLRYRDLVEAVALALGRPARILPMPAAAIHLASLILPGPLAPVAASLLRRLEDQTFPLDDMRMRLGVTPRPFQLDDGAAYAGAGLGSGFPAKV